MATSGRVHDRAVLDALESVEPTDWTSKVWRITRAGYNAIGGSSANGRWSPGGTVEVLYTSLASEGSTAEVGFRLGLEPAWPSRIQHEIHEISVQASRILRFPDVQGLEKFDIDPSKFESFDYGASQSLAAAAHFLECDGLIVPSARHNSLNLVLFMDRPAAGSLEVLASSPVDWSSWRRVRK